LSHFYGKGGGFPAVGTAAQVAYELLRQPTVLAEEESSSPLQDVPARNELGCFFLLFHIVRLS
jgi:hypothetical protein